MSEIIEAKDLKPGCFRLPENGEKCAKIDSCTFASKNGRYFLGACLHSLDNAEIPNNLGIDDRKMEGGLSTE